MTNKYTEHLKDRAEYNHAQAVYWTAQALDSLSKGYYKTAFNGLQNASGHIYDLDRHTAQIPDRPDLQSPELAQEHHTAIKTAKERAEQELKDCTDDLDPERVETIADLRERIKAGDPTARELVNDLIADCPTQCTAWIQREDLDRWTADDYTPEQQNELWEMLKTADILDLDGEIRNICEIYDTEQGAE